MSPTKGLKAFFRGRFGEKRESLPSSLGRGNTASTPLSTTLSQAGLPMERLNSDASEVGSDASHASRLSLSSVTSLAQSLSRALGGTMIGRSEITRALGFAGLTAEEADGLYSHVLANFDAWTRTTDDGARVPFTVKRGCEIEDGRSLARSLEVVPEGHAGGPVVVIRLYPAGRAPLMSGAQKEIKPTLVLTKHGEVLVANEGARARALERDPQRASVNREDLEREAVLMVEMSTRPPPGVLPLLTTYALPCDEPSDENAPRTKRLIVSEMMSGTLDALLDERTRPRDAASQRDLMLKLAYAVADLHGQGLLHNDLKENNFLYSGPLNAPRIVVADLALSSKLKDGRALGKTGSPFYTSPTSLKRTAIDEEGNIELTRANDVWALGLVFHRVVTGKLPAFLSLDSKNAESSGKPLEVLAARTMYALGQLTKADVEGELPEGLFKPLLSGMLEIEEDRRWTLEKVVRYLDGARIPKEQVDPVAESLTRYMTARPLAPRHAAGIMRALALRVMRLHDLNRVHGDIGMDSIFLHRVGGAVRLELRALAPSSESSAVPSGPASELAETPFTDVDRHVLESVVGLGQPSPASRSLSRFAAQRSVDRIGEFSAESEHTMQAVLDLGRAEDIRALGRVFEKLCAPGGNANASRPPALHALIAAMTHESPGERPNIREVAQRLQVLFSRPRVDE